MVGTGTAKPSSFLISNSENTHQEDSDSEHIRGLQRSSKEYVHRSKYKSCVATCALPVALYGRDYWSNASFSSNRGAI